jgi:multiple sugar transport system ATP-binding protein
MASIAIRDVHKAFGTTRVIKGVDIAIADGEFVVLVGPSGCGKSTLLRMIAGLENITSGEMRIGDRVVNNVPPKERDVAMVFQNYALYPHMTVAANMGFSLKLRGASNAEIDTRVKRAAEILGLAHLLDRFPRQLSGGQRQRVAMGRAIVRDPQVFLFDEPLSNLDAQLRVQMRTEIKDLHQRLRTTTVYVTHDQIEAMTMADKIVVMHDGIVEQIGAPLDLYDRPDNMFVAGFIGSPAMNLLPGTIRANGAVGFEGPGGIRLPLDAALASFDGRPVVYGIRPEHFTLAGDGVEAEVRVVEPTGSELHVVAKLGGEEIIAAVTASLANLRGLAHGPYARHNISRIVDPLGSRVETFLRTAVFPLSSRRDNFFHLVDNLGKTGIDQLSIDRLHALRGLYNDSKHDPPTPLLLAAAHRDRRERCCRSPDRLRPEH